MPRWPPLARRGPRARARRPGPLERDAGRGRRGGGERLGAPRAAGPGARTLVAGRDGRTGAGDVPSLRRPARRPAAAQLGHRDRIGPRADRATRLVRVRPLRDALAPRRARRRARVGPGRRRARRALRLPSARIPDLHDPAAHRGGARRQRARRALGALVGDGGAPLPSEPLALRSDASRRLPGLACAGDRRRDSRAACRACRRRPADGEPALSCRRRDGRPHLARRGRGDLAAGVASAMAAAWKGDGSAAHASLGGAHRCWVSGSRESARRAAELAAAMPAPWWEEPCPRGDGVDVRRPRAACRRATTSRARRPARSRRRDTGGRSRCREGGAPGGWRWRGQRSAGR